MPMKSDLEIAQSAEVKPITEIAAEYGIPEEALISYGTALAKVRPSLCPAFAAPRARYIDVTAITPTPLGEGKTTTTVGLTQGLGFLGRKAACAIRQPSMGPTFGIKGGAAGGGRSQVLPMEEINLHLTGDIHAVCAAHNLGAAAVDARIYHEGRWGRFLFDQAGTRAAFRESPRGELAPGGGHERPLLEEHYNGARRCRRRSDSADRFRYRRGQRTHGHSGPFERFAGHAQAHRRHGYGP